MTEENLEHLSRESLQIGQLLAKKIQGTLTVEQKKELEELIQIHPITQQLYDSYLDKGVLAGNQNYLASLNSMQAWDQIKQKVDNDIPKIKSVKSNPRWWYYVAASLLLLIGFSLLFTHLNQQLSGIIPDEKYGYNNDVLPGTNTAELRLANGDIIQLGSKNDLQIKEDGTSFRIKQGELSFELSPSEKPNKNLNLIEKKHTLHVPEGGTFSIILSDGTRVKLNASSKLTFPSQFCKNTREVYLDGEGYFEVKKNTKVPFIVNSKQGEIRVLGTQFNLNTYNKNQSEVTLVHGSIQINDMKTTRVLKPGQQAVFGKSDLIVQEVNIEKYIAWNEDYFYFMNDSIESIMNQISRWYGIKVQFNGINNNKKYGGSISRDATLAEVLEQLKKVSQLKFNIHKKSVTVIF